MVEPKWCRLQGKVLVYPLASPVVYMRVKGSANCLLRAVTVHILANMGKMSWHFFIQHVIGKAYNMMNL